MFAVSDMRQVPFADSGFSGIAAAEAFGFAVVALLAIWLTYIGFGSIVLWAFRFAIVQFGALGTLMSRALPLLMLTVVVYFTGELWQLAARMTRQRLWQTVGFLTIVAIVFMVTTIRDEVLALREDRAEQDDPAKLLADTPLATSSDHQPARTPLSLAEQVNVVAVMVVAQAIQVVFFTAGLFAFFLALGIIAVPDDVTVLWSAEESCPVGEPPCAGTWFGMAVFTFDAGRPVFELVDPDGQRWAMQTWSQTVDSALSLDDLPDLAGRLKLPEGWSFQTRTLTSPLRVDTSTRNAHVVQDDLANSYSLQRPG
jgi:hypothetical protein